MEIRQRQLGNVIGLDVAGRMVMGAVDRLNDEVNRLFREGRRDILLNLADVSQVDTTGLAAIIAVRMAAERQGRNIKLLNLPKRVYSLLVVTKLITLFEVFESEGDALRSFGQPA